MRSKFTLKTDLLLVIFISVTMTVSFAQNFNSYYAQGVSYFNVGNYKMAEKYLKEALTLQPSLENTSNIKSLIGLSSLYSGDIVTARAYLPEELLNTAYGTASQLHSGNMVNQIANWEQNPLLNSYQQSNPKNIKVLSWISFMIFMAFFIVITGGIIAYFMIRKRKLMLNNASLNILEDEKENLTIPDFMKTKDNEKILSENSVQLLNDEEIEKRLNKALEGTKKKEEVKTIVEPEKIVQNTKSDPSDEDLKILAQAIQDILSKDSENSDK